MKFDFQNILDPGIIATERLVLRATIDADIGRFAIFWGSNVAQGKVASGNTLGFWFPDKPIKVGELVILYSRVGTSSEKKLDGGKTSHFFYWGRSSPLWIKGHTPILLEVATWSAGQRFE